MNKFPVIINIPAINRETAEKLLEVKLQWVANKQDWAELAVKVLDAFQLKIKAENLLVSADVPLGQALTHKTNHEFTLWVEAESEREAYGKVNCMLLASNLPFTLHWKPIVFGLGLAWAASWLLPADNYTGDSISLRRKWKRQGRKNSFMRTMRTAISNPPSNQIKTTRNENRNYANEQEYQSGKTATHFRQAKNLSVL
jgi:hypothetical protein